MKYLILFLLVSFHVQAQAGVNPVSSITCETVQKQYGQKIKFEWLIELETPRYGLAQVTYTNNVGGTKSTYIDENVEYEIDLKAPSQVSVYTFTDGNGFKWSVTEAEDGVNATLDYGGYFTADCTLN